MGGQMDTEMKEVAYMWREMNDEWYRLQTNSKKIIKKLLKRKTASVCSKTVSGSSSYWYVFRLRYNKPSTARQGFKRIIGQKEIKVSKSGLFSAVLVHKLDIIKDVR